MAEAECKYLKKLLESVVLVNIVGETNSVSPCWIPVEIHAAVVCDNLDIVDNISVVGRL